MRPQEPLTRRRFLAAAAAGAGALGAAAVGLGGDAGAKPGGVKPTPRNTRVTVGPTAAAMSVREYRETQLTYSSFRTMGLAAFKANHSQYVGLLPDEPLNPTPITANTLVPGQTVTGRIIDFFVDPPTSDGPEILLDNCWIRGPLSGPPGGPIGLIKAYDIGHCPIRLKHCLLKPQTPHWNTNGIHGYRFAAEFCEIDRPSDGLSVFRSPSDPNKNGPLDASFVMGWIHDIAWWSQAVSNTSTFDGPHSEPLQLQGGQGFQLRGSVLEGFNAPEYTPNYYGTNHANTCIMITPDVADITQTLIEDNLLSGGGATLILAHDEGSGHYIGDLGRIARNGFLRDSSRVTVSGNPVEIFRPTTIPVTVDWGTGADVNFYTDTGTGPVTLSNGG